MPNATLVNFVAGETSPRSRGRFDLDWFKSSCEKVLNFIPEVPGSIRYRTGFKALRQTRGGAIARLVPFQFSDSIAYQLEFTPGFMRVYKNEDLLTKTPYDVLNTTTVLDAFTDGDYTTSPAWTVYIAARVSAATNALVMTSHNPGGGVVGGAARTPQTRNIGTFQFDVDIEDDGHVMFFATTYTPTVDANGVTAWTGTGYAIYRAGANYFFARVDAGAFTNLIDLGAYSAGAKTFTIVRDVVGNFTIDVDGTTFTAVKDATYTSCLYFAALSSFDGTDAKTVILDNISIPGVGATENQGVVTGVTQANPGVVTVASVGDLADGDECILSGFTGGMLELNGRQVKLANNAGSDFDLVDPVTGDNINTSGFDAWSAGGTLAEVYEIATPYFAVDLDGLQWAVSARDGVMYFTHPHYAPYKLSVDSSENFVLATYARTNDPFVNQLADLTITAIDLASDNTLVYFTPGSIINQNSLYTFSGIVGTTELNTGTYRLKIPAGIFSTPRAHLVTTAGAVVDSSAWTAYTSGGIAASDVEHPLSCGFYENRLGFFGTSQRPNSNFMSRSPDTTVGDPRYDDFTGGADDTHAVFFALAPVSGQVDFASWVRGTAKYLLLGTFGGPFRVSGAGLDTPITPSSINARQIDLDGCEAVMPAGAPRVFFVQRGGRTIKAIAYNDDEDDLESRDMTLNAEHIGESRLLRVVLQTGQPDVLWATRTDGILAGMTVEGNENIAGWHRHEIGGTAPKVLDAQPLARTDENDRLWIVSERLIGSTTRRFVEIATDDVFFKDLDDFYTGKGNEADDLACYLGHVYRRQEEYVNMDAAKTYNGSDVGTDAGATLTPAAVTGDAIAFTAVGGNVFVSTDVGREIWRKPDRETGAGSGRGVIVTYNSPTSVDVDITADFGSTDAIPAGDWYLTATTLYGLSHLEGEDVAVVADGAVVTDGLGVVGDTITVASGKITIPAAAAVVHVGLPYEGFIKTHNLEMGGRSGPASNKPRNISEMFIRFLYTLGVSYGTDIYDLQNIDHRLASDIADRPTPVFSGAKALTNPDNFEAEKGKFVYINQRLPLPCIVLAIDLRYDVVDVG